MKNILGAVAAIAVLTPAGAASAALLLSQSGTQSTQGNGYYEVEILPSTYASPYKFFPQTIRVAFDFYVAGAPNSASISGVMNTYRFFPDGYIDPTYDDGFYGSLAAAGSYGDQVSWTPTATGFIATLRPTSDDCSAWRPGFSCTYSEAASLKFAVPGSEGDLSYRFSVSSVPEPATWAMMIIGFGLIGSMVRTSRRRYGINPA